MSHLKLEERQKYTDAFNEADENNDGLLNLPEFEDLCRTLRFTFTPPQTKELFFQVDTDDNGLITMHEFLSVIQPEQPDKRKEKISPDSHLSRKERKYYTDVYNEMDVNKDGRLNLVELEALCQALGFTFEKSQVEELFTQLDTDNSGDITLDEFLSVMQPLPRKDKRCAKIRRIFKMADTNKDGFLTVKELHEALSSASNENDQQLEKGKVEELVAAADADGDGVLNYEEFLYLLKPLLE